MRHIVNVIVLIILICASFASAAAADSLEWIYSYEDALKLASREGKPIMVGCYTSWCGWCKKLDETTYVDSAVVSASKKFVCLKVDCEKRRDVAYGYGVKSLPTILFLDSSGRMIWREFGYREPAFLARRMGEVLAVFTAARAVEPFIRKAFDAAGRGEVDRAIAILNEGIAAYPDEARLYAARSVFHGQKRDLDLALQDLDKALSLNPDDDVVLAMRGMAYYEKKAFEKAMADYNKAIAVNRWAYEAYNGRGMIYLEEKDPDLAIKNFNAVTLINPRYADAYLNRGVAYIIKAEFDKAISDFSMAIKLNPDMLNAYSNRAAAYMYARQYDKSWSDVDTIERRGFHMNPELIAELRRLSGREK